MSDAATDIIERFRPGELAELCDATRKALDDGIGFGWVTMPSDERLETYWKGVLVVPHRTLIVGRYRGVVAGSVQVVRPVTRDEARAFSASVDTHFVAPWARGHGLAGALLDHAERHAAAAGFTQICLDVRVTQTQAIGLYEANGYERWGTLPDYHRVGRKMVAGHFYRKKIS